MYIYSPGQNVFLINRSYKLSIRQIQRVLYNSIHKHFELHLSIINQCMKSEDIPIARFFQVFFFFVIVYFHLFIFSIQKQLQIYNLQVHEKSTEQKNSAYVQERCNRLFSYAYITVYSYRTHNGENNEQPLFSFFSNVIGLVCSLTLPILLRI